MSANNQNIDIEKLLAIIPHDFGKAIWLFRRSVPALLFFILIFQYSYN